MTVQTTFHTGDLPTEAMIPDRNNLKAMEYRDYRELWAGCLDAPGYVPAGSTLAPNPLYREVPPSSSYTPRPNY